MSVEIENELNKLKVSQNELLSHLNKFDGLDDDETRIPILNLVNTFSDGLRFLKNELKFEYEVDFNKPIRTNDQALLEYVLNYEKSNQFLDSFKKTFVKKQNQLKRLEIQRFQQLKNEKYGSKPDLDTNEDPVSSKSTETPQVTTNSKIMSTTKKITSKLSQSSRILQSSLMQSQLNMDELSVQSDSLTHLADRYGYLKGVLEKSDGFINDIKLSSERDKNYMYYALVFFGLCVLKVFWSRLFKLPAMFVFKIIFYIFKLTLATIGLISPRKVEVDFASSLTDTHASVTTSITSSFIPEEQIVSSTDVIEKSGISKSISSDSDSNESEDQYDEELSRIIDEL